MRLTPKEQQAIQSTFREVFKEGSLYLFGSRVDDGRRGGDIDLYISTNQRENLAKNKIQFLGALQREIGEQKIDIVIDHGGSRPIDIKAQKEGVLLCKTS